MENEYPVAVTKWVEFKSFSFVHAEHWAFSRGKWVHMIEE
jgi:hypothetical protein